MRVVETLRPGRWRLARLHHGDGRVEFATGPYARKDEYHGQRLPMGLGNPPGPLVECGPNVIVEAALEAGQGMFRDPATGLTYEAHLKALSGVLQAVALGNLRGRAGLIEGLWTFMAVGSHVSITGYVGPRPAGARLTAEAGDAPDLSDFIKTLSTGA